MPHPIILEPTTAGRNSLKLTLYLNPIEVSKYKDLETHIFRTKGFYINIFLKQALIQMLSESASPSPDGRVQSVTYPSHVLSWRCGGGVVENCDI